MNKIFNVPLMTAFEPKADSLLILNERKSMKTLSVTLVVVLLVSCTSPAGWKTRFNAGEYESTSGEFLVQSPIDTGFCLNIEERSGPPETVMFSECHGYYGESYYITWYKVEPFDDELEFYERTENDIIPALSKKIFEPIDEGIPTSTQRKIVNGRPAVEFDVKTKSDAQSLRMRSRSILYDDRVLSISIIYDLHKNSPGYTAGSTAMFSNYDRFVSSFKRK